MPGFFFYIYFFYKFKYNFKKEIVNSFKSQIKYTIIINTIYIYYIIMFKIVKFEVKVIFIVKIFFVVSFYNIKIDSYNYKFFVFSFRRQIRLYIYIKVF